MFGFVRMIILVICPFVLLCVKRWAYKSSFKRPSKKLRVAMAIMLDSCRLIFERSHFERSENEFFKSRFSDLLELNSCTKLQN